MGACKQVNIKANSMTFFNYSHFRTELYIEGKEGLCIFFILFVLCPTYWAQIAQKYCYLPVADSLLNESYKVQRGIHTEGYNMDFFKIISMFNDNRRSLVSKKRMEQTKGGNSYCNFLISCICRYRWKWRKNW